MDPVNRSLPLQSAHSVVQVSDYKRICFVCEALKLIRACFPLLGTNFPPSNIRQGCGGAIGNGEWQDIGFCCTDFECYQ